MDIQVAPWAAAFFASLFAGYERYQNSKAQAKATNIALVKEEKTQQEQDLLSDAKRLQERADLLGKLADDNATLFRAEQAAHKETREYWHAKGTEFQLSLSTCQDKLQEMQQRPDYSDILELIKQQAEISNQTLSAIKEVLTLIKNK